MVKRLIKTSLRRVAHVRAAGLLGVGLLVPLYGRDRYHLLVFPVVLGTGRRLFATDDDAAYARLELLEQEAYPNGIVKLVYDVRR